jgi:hypothetical protein
LRIAVISAGVAFLPERFARILSSGGYDAKFYPLDPNVGYSYVDWGSVDLVWNVGFFFGPDQLFDVIKERNPGIRIVNWWVGSDILQFYNYVRARPKCRGCMLKSIDAHVVDAPEFIEEVKGFGVEASYVPSIPDPMPLTPLPMEFSVALYIPSYRPEFYGYEILVEAARQLPDVPFYAFPSINGWGKLTPPLSNIHFMPFVQGEGKLAAFSKCSSFISIPVHGGRSLMAIEFLQMGRRVIMNKPMPHVYYVEEPVDPDKIVAYLKEIMKFKEPDEEASRYYHKEYSPEKVLLHVKPVLEALGFG